MGWLLLLLRIGLEDEIKAKAQGRSDLRAERTGPAHREDLEASESGLSLWARPCNEMVKSSGHQLPLYLLISYCTNDEGVNIEDHNDRAAQGQFSSEHLFVSLLFQIFKFSQSSQNFCSPLFSVRFACSVLLL